jgi:tetratricopeptide (TPR) repeat protein
MYQGLASANRKAGHAEAAATWEARAAASAPYGILFAGRSASWAGIGLNGIAAAMVALFLALVVKALRSGPDPRTARGLARWNMFAGWTRGEILGFLLVHILLVVALVTVVRGVSAIARSAAAPLGAVSGNFGHPDGIEYFATLQGTPAGDFVYALALHKGGELDRAASIYARLRSPRAVNNLGVILHARGQADEARKLFEAARSADATLAEAAYNLDQPTTSARVQRARELGVAGPLQAMPTPQMWSQALAGPLQLWSLPGQALGVASLPSDQASRGERAASMVVGAVFTLLYLGVGALAILALLGIMHAGAPAPRSRRTLAGWALGFVVPGTARQLGALGPPLLTLCAFSYFVHYALGLSEGWRPTSSERSRSRHRQLPRHCRTRLHAVGAAGARDSQSVLDAVDRQPRRGDPARASVARSRRAPVQAARRGARVAPPDPTRSRGRKAVRRSLRAPPPRTPDPSARPSASGTSAATAPAPPPAPNGAGAGPRRTADRSPAGAAESGSRSSSRSWPRRAPP